MGTAQGLATEVVTYEDRLVGVETRLPVLTWMIGANPAISIPILFKVFH